MLSYKPNRTETARQRWVRDRQTWRVTSNPTSSAAHGDAEHARVHESLSSKATQTLIS